MSDTTTSPDVAPAQPRATKPRPRPEQPEPVQPAPAPTPAPVVVVAAPAPPPIVAALTAVMRAVGAVGKRERNAQQGFNFRGIDAVVNATNHALIEHGVVVVPMLVDKAYVDVTTAKGALMTGVRVTVTYRFHGPAGDHLDATVAAEAFDSGDKATAKAMSVAFRTALLQTLALPTDDPDPDASSYERGRPEQFERTRPAGPPVDDPWASAPAAPSAERVTMAYASLFDIVRDNEPGPARIAALKAWWREWTPERAALVDPEPEFLAAGVPPERVTLGDLSKAVAKITMATEATP